MELYTLDAAFMKLDVIDDFISLIWTERFNQYGDVTLIFPANSPNGKNIVEGTFLSITDSKEVMLVDTVSTESGITTVTGQTLIGFLANRIFRKTWGTTNDNTWQLTGTAGAIANAMMSAMVGAGGAMATGGVVPSGGNLEVLSHLVLGTAAGGTSFTTAVPYGTLYDSIKTVCDLGATGFRLYPDNISSSGYDMTFETYLGKDLTTDQSSNPPVIFEPAMDSFTDIKEIRSTSGYRNVAYVFPNNPTVIGQVVVVYAPGANLLTDFARRSIMVDASDVNAPDYSASDLTSILTQRGKDALANNNYVRMTDGQLVPQNAFVYGVDYDLGDIIELRGTSDDAQQARITEYIRSQDDTGEIAYPTLSVI